MAFYTLADRAISTVETTLTDSANHVHVKSADYALFPATGTYPITICLLTSGVESNVERVLCTSKTGPDILNITRAQFGTSAAEHAVGELVQLRVTEGVLSQFQGQSATINAYALNALNRPQETVAGIHYVLTGTADQTILNTALSAMA